MSIRINSLPAGTPNDNDVFAFDGVGGTKKVSKGDLLGDIKQDVTDVKASLRDVLPAEYSTSATYNVGATCMHNGKMYQCNSNNVTGAWNPSYWSETRIGNVATLSYTVASEW